MYTRALFFLASLCIAQSVMGLSLFPPKYTSFGSVQSTENLVIVNNRLFVSGQGAIYEIINDKTRVAYPPPPLVSVPFSFLGLATNNNILYAIVYDECDTKSQKFIYAFTLGANPGDPLNLVATYRLQLAANVPNGLAFYAGATHNALYLSDFGILSGGIISVSVSADGLSFSGETIRLSSPLVNGVRVSGSNIFYSTTLAIRTAKISGADLSLSAHKTIYAGSLLTLTLPSFDDFAVVSSGTSVTLYIANYATSEIVRVTVDLTTNAQSNKDSVFFLGLLPSSVLVQPAPLNRLIVAAKGVLGCRMPAGSVGTIPLKW